MFLVHKFKVYTFHKKKWGYNNNFIYHLLHLYFLLFDFCFSQIRNYRISISEKRSVSKKSIFFRGIYILRVLASCLLFQIFPMQWFFFLVKQKTCSTIVQKKVSQFFFFFFCLLGLSDHAIFFKLTYFMFLFLDNASFFCGLRDDFF